jgi:hypothetical protein
MNVLDIERWYAVHTIPRSEYLADVKLRALGYKTFFPHSVEIIGQSKWKSRFVKVAYLTRYTFVCFRPERVHLESAYQINNLLNREGEYLCRMVYAGVDSNGDRMPFPIPLKIIEELKVLCEPDGQLAGGGPLDSSRQKLWKRHDRVKVAEGLGALFGLFGTIEEVMPNGKQLRIVLDKAIAGQSMVTVNTSNIEEVTHS